MNTQKSIYNKLFKAEAVELESHKVELALVDDFTKEYEKALDLQAKAEIAIIDYNELANKIITSLKEAGQTFLKATARYQEIEKMAKDLGIDPSPQLKSKRETISVAIKEIDAYTKKLISNKVNV